MGQTSIHYSLLTMTSKGWIKIAVLCALVENKSFKVEFFLVNFKSYIFFHREYIVPFEVKLHFDKLLSAA